MKDKNIYYQFSDGFDISKVIISLPDCLAWIESDMEKWSEGDELPEYTITPVWMTDDEYKRLFP